MMSSKFVFVMFMLIAGSFAYDDSYYKIDSIETIKSFQPVFLNETRYVNKSSPLNIDISTIITIGKEVWEIIKAGKPVVDYKIDYGGVVPKGVDWTELEGFKSAKWGPFGWVFKDLYGLETVKFKWNFGFNCKGSYQGHGMFLTDVVTAVNEIYAAWGFTVNAVATVGQQPTNYGTKIDPIAGLPIEVTISVKTVLQSFTEKCTVVVKGDCSGVVVSC